ncbi:hypothetical protein AKJ37_02645 [candidate division MSBL1 archaeon SCGC-AAA259I09]|uniref:Restriction endonuclease n=4 Tax=candidate division MSBL1 TaxID=215777 RepID=A0A133UU22_9EURY|nr:hypothetical protein AKJ62_02590 [candidate division MSBL1 archaeon SCGC-AAA259D14]KXA94295.1 hypothetical protein AKJ36_03115 [candidate division MSBL1 archaeon SCGC-AAA259I07]KXA97630.1 hypothetical protein AKJ37_02645 [candidate division MSBL1 archaeon SCGC-AAA259I09]KXB00659.1 hypothetical protein AKJ40_01030 [candidate division MSBL1 archaeon SCGC-AAA259M10]
MRNSQLREYISKTRSASTHFSKSRRFLDFVENIFGGKVEIGFAKEIFPELEKSLVNEQGTVAVRGEAGAPLGNLIIEFKTSKLDPMRSEEIIEKAKDQLRRCICILWKKHGQGLRYLLMASDGLRNFVYRPSLEGSIEDLEVGEEIHAGELDEKLRETINLEQIDEIDISKADSEHVYAWLERYLLHE